MLEHNNNHIKFPEEFNNDIDILEKGLKVFLKPYKNMKTKKMEVRDINDVDQHDSLRWELYWYIFDKKNPDLLNGQTVKGQKAYLHNMVAMQSLLRGQPVKFYSTSNSKEPDMTITLEQFNNDLGELRPSTITAFNKPI